MTVWESSKDNKKLYELWSRFLEVWPVSRVREMTLDEYSKAGDFETFCAWIENKLDKSGSIWGGSAFKFGVYSRKDKTLKESTNRYSWSDSYAWDRRFGESEYKAFEVVKTNILRVIEAVEKGDLQAIEAVGLSSVVKWKIASLYQSSDKPIIPSVFKREHLCAYLETDNGDLTLADLYPRVMQSFDGKDIYAFSRDVWNIGELRLNEKIRKQDAIRSLPNDASKVWLFAPGYNASKWSEFKKNNIVAIGWEELGDLNDYADKTEIISALQEIQSTNASKKNDATANFEFKSVMKVGDIVIVKKGRSTLLGYGIVSSDYYYDSNRVDFKKCRKVEWKKTGNWEVDHKLAIKTLTNITDYDSDKKEFNSYFDRLMAAMGVTSKEASTMNSELKQELPKNIIFYGPPGTGKTYKLYKDYINQYVDRAAKVTDQEWLRYNIDGLRWLDVLALSLLDLGGGPVKVADLQEHRFLREYLSVLGAGPKNVRATIWGVMQAHTDADCEHVKLAVRRSPSWFFKGADSQWSFSDDWLESGSEISELLKKIKAGPQTIDEEDRKRYEFVTFHQSYSYEEFVEGIRPVLSSDENDNEVRYELHKGIFREICEKAERDKSGKRYAIFIDEINRGNISKIFGELITLIEKDKRAGCEGVVPLKLPYSKQDFSVPKNLDIYGTMNTADRSLAYLDTALRRRFSFIEVMPDPSELGSVDFDGREVDLKALLTKINLRLESLLDREHTLGHAYLMGSGKTVEKEGLISAFKEKIIPQLTDYFYEDWDKVRLVLADNQVTDRNLEFVSKGEVDKSLFGSDVPGEILQRFELNRDALNNPEAYIKIYSVLGSSES